MIIKNWHYKEDKFQNLLLFSGLIIVVATWLYFVSDRNFEIIVYASFMLITLGFNAAEKLYNRKNQYFIVKTGKTVSKQIVINTLRKKNLPFRYVTRGLSLKEEDLVIGISNYGDGDGSIISIGPTKEENELMVQSLKKRIQNEFHITKWPNHIY